MSEDRSVLTAPGPQPQLLLRYADHADGVAEAHLPPDDDIRRVVVLVHGGFWRAEFDRAHLRPLAAALAAAGAAVVLPEYRRGPGSWPGMVEDVAAAVDVTARELTGPLVLGGHSAGGHLALWLAGQPPAAVERVVALAPVADLHLAAQERLSGDAVAVFGANHAAADPVRRPPPSVPVTVLHGRFDTVVPPSLSRSYASRQCAALVELDREHVELIELDSEHVELIELDTGTSS